MSDGDSKDIVRRWNREIEAEIRREAVLRDRDGAVEGGHVDGVMGCVAGLLVLVLMFLRTLH